MNDFATFADNAISFVATYFVHSTVLLTSCWIILCISRPTSHFLTERLWKLAAVLGFVTAATQMFVVPGHVPASSLAQLIVEPVTDLPAVVATYNDLARDEFDETRVADTTEWLDQRPYHETEATPQYEIESSSVFTEQHTGQGVATVTDIQPLASETMHDAPIQDNEALLTLEAAAVPKDVDAITPTVRSQSAINEWLRFAIKICSITMLCGGVAGGLLLMIQATRWRLRFGRVSTLNSGPAFDAMQRFRKRHKIHRRLRLLESTTHAEPFAYGLFRWTIVLPVGVEDRLERNELKALIAHEVAHLVRGDVRWLWIGRLLCTCCAFQPLNFLARRRWQQSAEFLCDDWAIERGVRSLALARCLTRVAEWRFGIESHEVGLAAGGSKATLVDRVQRLVSEQSSHDTWKTPWRRRALTMGAAIAVVGLVGFMPRIALPSAALPLARVSDYVAEVTSISIAPAVDGSTASDWHALEEELLQLDADLAKVNELRLSRSQIRGSNEMNMISYFENLNRRAASLRSRREQIASLIEKESER